MREVERSIFQPHQPASTASVLPKNGGWEDCGPKAAANHLINESKRQLDEKLATIWKSLDWNEPNIAFYGETNAGKSTLIEALRSLFGSSGDKQGHSIGDGLPDHTREATSYPCEYDGARFNLVDVPGIEGKEAEVISEIENAINSAHAVFYVTADARPPQGGDEKREGTLGKIKRQLKPQAKVWAIYNKKLHNPRQIGASLANYDETESLSCGQNSLDGKMREALGNHYEGHIILSALPGFLALADNLSPDSRFAPQREKFLTRVSASELLGFSNIEKFGKLLRQNVPSSDEIAQANIRKLVPPVEEAAALLDWEAEKQFTIPAQELAKQLARLGPELEMIADDASKGINRLADELTNGFVKRVRETMLQAINSGLASDDDVKKKIEQILENEKSKIPEIINEKVSTTVKRTQKSCAESLQLVEKHLKDVRAFESLSFASSFYHAVEVETRSGVDWWGLGGSGVGLLVVGGSLLTGGAVAGIVAAMSALSAAAGVVRSVWNYFSIDYRKRQQKQSLNKNLDDIKSNIRTNITKSLRKIELNIRGHVLNMMIPLRNAETDFQEIGLIVKKNASAFREMAGNNAQLLQYAEEISSPA